MQSTPYLVDMTELLEEQGKDGNAPPPKRNFYKFPYSCGEDNRQNEEHWCRYQPVGRVGGGGGRVLMPPTVSPTRATAHIQVLCFYLRSEILRSRFGFLGSIYILPVVVVPYI
jgi:hypothetical protein